MTGNRIGVEGAKSMSETLKVNTTLTSLNLCGEKEEKKGKGKEQREVRKNDREEDWS